MRISTAGMYAQGLQAMLQRQGELARTSEQMSSGVRFTRAGQDPAAASTAQGLDHALASLEQYERSAGHVERRLELHRLPRAKEYPRAPVGAPRASAHDRHAARAP